MKDFVFYNDHCICVDDLQEFYLIYDKKKRVFLINLVYPATTHYLSFDDEKFAKEFYVALLKYVDAELLMVDVDERETTDSNVISINKKKT